MKYKIGFLFLSGALIMASCTTQTQDFCNEINQPYAELSAYIEQNDVDIRAVESEVPYYNELGMFVLENC